MPIRSRLNYLIRELTLTRDAMLALEHDVLPEYDIHPTFAESARNLVHYVALRCRDLRAVQSELADLGVSSLGRSEPHVLGNVNSVLNLLQMAAGREPLPAQAGHPISLLEGRALLDVHTRELLGRPPAARDVRIMVTLPSESADDRQLMRSLVDSGMDCVRINCAHDDPAVWSKMIENLRAVERETGLSHPVAMDLAGPKLRTGPVLPGPAALKLSPKRDDFGFVVRPAVACLVGDDLPRRPLPPGCQVALPVDAGFLALLREGDTICFDDARGASRSFVAGEEVDGGRIVECRRTAYLSPGVVLRRGDASSRLTRLPHRDGEIRLRLGDRLVVMHGEEPGVGAELDDDGSVVRPARIACSIANVFSRVAEGDRVFLDDGRIGGVVRSVEPGSFELEVTRARPGGERLSADKGINLPDTDLCLPALTGKDYSDLEFVATHADFVNFSFVNQPSDVDALTDWLESHNAGHLGVVLKIETKRSF